MFKLSIFYLKIEKHKGNTSIVIESNLGVIHCVNLIIMNLFFKFITPFCLCHSLRVKHLRGVTTVLSLNLMSFKPFKFLNEFKIKTHKIKNKMLKSLKTNPLSLLI